LQAGRPKYELRNAATELTNVRTLLHAFRVEPVERTLGEGQKVAMDVQEKADRASTEHLYRLVYIPYSLVPIWIVVGLLLLYIHTLQFPKSPPDSL
jgi:hypothetical protein